MQKVQQLIEEIRELKNDISHRSALRVFSLLENNRKLFLEKMDETDFNYLINSFEEITNTNAREYGTMAYKNEYLKQFELLLFHLNKII